MAAGSLYGSFSYNFFFRKFSVFAWCRSKSSAMESQTDSRGIRLQSNSGSRRWRSFPINFKGKLSGAWYKGKKDFSCFVSNFTHRMIIRPDVTSPVHLFTRQSMTGLATVEVASLLKLENNNGQV